MLVQFKRNWFGPDGNLYRAKSAAHALPDGWRDKLPSDAVITDGGGEKSSPLSISDEATEPVKRGPGRPRKEA